MSGNSRPMPWPVWMLFGLVGGAVLGGGGVLLTLSARLDDAAMGWRLKPIMVASEDVAEGTPLSLEQLGERQVPEQFVMPTMLLREDVRGLLGKQVSVPLQAGDPLEAALVGERQRVLDCSRDIGATAKVLGLEQDPGVVALRAKIEAMQGKETPLPP